MIYHIEHMKGDLPYIYKLILRYLKINFGNEVPLFKDCRYIIIEFIDFWIINIELGINLSVLLIATTFIFFQNPPKVREDTIARWCRVFRRMESDLYTLKFYVRAISALFLVFISDIFDSNLDFVHWLCIISYVMAGTTININKWDGPADEFLIYRLGSPIVFAIMLYIFSITIWIHINVDDIGFVTYYAIKFKLLVSYCVIKFKLLVIYYVIKFKALVIYYAIKYIP